MTIPVVVIPVMWSPMPTTVRSCSSYHWPWVFIRMTSQTYTIVNFPLFCQWHTIAKQSPYALLDCKALNWIIEACFALTPAESVGSDLVKRLDLSRWPEAGHSVVLGNTNWDEMLVRCTLVQLIWVELGIGDNNFATPWKRCFGRTVPPDFYLICSTSIMMAIHLM